MIDISKAISNNAYMVFSKFPNLSFFIKTIQLPSTTTGTTRLPLPQHFAWNIPSVTADTEDSTIMWYLDENLITYFQLMKWMKECRNTPDITKCMSDATITITNNAKIPIINITMIDTWVSNVGMLDFDTYSTDPLTPFFSLKCYGVKWKYLISGIDIPEDFS